MLPVFLVALAVAAPVAVAYYLGRVEPWRRTVIARRASIVTRTGTTVSGYVVDRRGPLLVVKDAALHHDGATVPLDGDVVVERSNVDFVQILGEA